MNLTEERYKSTSIYKGGYWRKWNTEYSLRAKANYSENEFTLLVYSEYNHPSDFQTKVTATNFVENEGKCLEYTGTVELLVSKKRVDGLNDYYTTKVNLYVVQENYITFPCTIRISKSIKDIFKKHGVINIFYNGVGRAYNF